MGIQIYFAIALTIVGIIVGAITLYFLSSVVWSHRWQEREREQQG